MLYTRKGDKGDTGFFGSNRRVSKASARPEALGALDELNSFLGVCKVKAEIRDTTTKEGGHILSKTLNDIQQNLFIVQGEVAGASTRITEEKVKQVEQIIADIEKELLPINTFKVAGGEQLSAMVDYARAVSRRAERRVVKVCETKEAQVSEHSLQYLNRLSSLLYALSRLINAKSGIKEQSPTYE